MNRYDWGWNRNFHRGPRPGPRGGYGSDFRGWGRGPGGGERPPGPGFDRYWDNLWEREGFAVGYDQDVYGGPYPGFGGYPGGGGRGVHYGGRGYGQQFEPRGEPGFEGRWEQPRGYDQGFAREPFVPEAAYRQHPDLARPRHDAGREWTEPLQHDVGEDLSDEEIRASVRQNLFNDNWVDAERIEVEVSDQVVTLTGEVDDYLEARYAWDDAWVAAGVHGVINQLTVRTPPAADKAADAPARTSGKGGK